MLFGVGSSAGGFGGVRGRGTAGTAGAACGIGCNGVGSLANLRPNLAGLVGGERDRTIASWWEVKARLALASAAVGRGKKLVGTPFLSSSRARRPKGGGFVFFSASPLPWLGGLRLAPGRAALTGSMGGCL